MNTTIAHQLAPSKVGTTYEVILEGDSRAERRGDRTPVVISQCGYRFKDDANLEKCITMLRQSDERLAANQDCQYDWNITMVSRDVADGGFIAFSVSWYNLEFFEAHRNTFVGSLHQRLYQSIGVTEGDFSVSHWQLAV